jgi:hypothetical protein
MVAVDQVDRDIVLTRRKVLEVDCASAARVRPVLRQAVHVDVPMADTAFPRSTSEAGMTMTSSFLSRSATLVLFVSSVCLLLSCSLLTRVVWGYPGKRPDLQHHPQASFPAYFLAGRAIIGVTPACSSAV